MTTGVPGGGSRYHGSFADLKRFAGLGRWEFGSQGHLAPTRIAMNVSGAEGLFLVSRRWIGAEGRLETRQEMAKRIEEDCRLSKKEIAKRLGLREVTAFAFPLGSLGQHDLTNEPQAYPLNLRIFRRQFRLGFHQSENAYNLKRRRLPILERFPVPGEWDGEKLLANLRRTDPAARARLEKGRLLANTGGISSGLEEIDRAAALGADEREVRFIRGNALLWRGDRILSAAECHSFDREFRSLRGEALPDLKTIQILCR